MSLTIQVMCPWCLENPKVPRPEKYMFLLFQNFTTITTARPFVLPSWYVDKALV